MQNYLKDLQVELNDNKAVEDLNVISFAKTESTPSAVMPSHFECSACNHTLLKGLVFLVSRSRSIIPNPRDATVPLKPHATHSLLEYCALREL